MNWTLYHCDQLEMLLGTSDPDAAIERIKDLLLPVPKAAQFAVMYDPVRVEEVKETMFLEKAERRTLRVLGRFRDGSVQAYSASRIIPAPYLTRTSEPDKLRHHVDNCMMNEVTRAVTEFAATKS